MKWNMIDNPQEREFFECSCTDMEHMFRLRHFKDDDPEGMDLYMDFYLSSHNSFLKRVWRGIKYAFGYKSRFGDFGEIILNKDTTARLHKYLEVYLLDYETAEQHSADINKATNTER